MGKSDRWKINRASTRSKGRPTEIALIGDLEECEGEVIERLLEVREGAPCTFYIDSGGGRVYSALAIMTMVLMKKPDATAIVIGSCSSAALMVLAACRRRLAVPYSVFHFHPVRWESSENIERVEAVEWAKHFAKLELECDRILAQLFGAPEELIQSWVRGNRYLSGRELAEAGVIELIDPLTDLTIPHRNHQRRSSV
jgi:ATP-dependent Clp protease protease subunit